MVVVLGFPSVLGQFGRDFLLTVAGEVPLVRLISSGESHGAVGKAVVSSAAGRAD